jgi:single-stranded DNA-binding protein
MLSVLATGTLVSDPRRRTTAAGKAFATALLRVPSEDADAMLVSIIAFDADAVAALLALAKGDACAISGRGKLTSWDKAGEEKHGLSVVADKVLTVYQAGKLRKQGRGETQDEYAAAEVGNHV